MIVASVASGTSADALDIGVVELDWTDGRDLVLEVVETWSEPWPEGLGDRILALLPPASTTAAEICAVDTAVGQAVGAAAARAVEVARRTTGSAPSLIVSPGQTVHHEVLDGRCLGSLQLGQPAWVVEATGLPVVSDLRARDVSAGGHGAPLASTLDALWLDGDSVAKAALNLGGIANVTVVRPGSPPLAWDTGPANCLLDVAARMATGNESGYDRDGALASSGRVRSDLLSVLLAHPHFARRPPVSTGRETFSATLLEEALAGCAPIAWSDVLATLTELTALTVARALAPFNVSEVVASGGGVANPALMAALARALGETRLLTSDELGIPADGKEAVMWALLGFLTWHGVPASTPATGASAARVLGRISPGDTALELPEPVRQLPGRLRVRSREVA